MTPSSAIDYAIAVADALNKWEPRVTFLRCNVSTVTEGKITLGVDYAVTGTGAVFSETITL